MTDRGSAEQSAPTGKDALLTSGPDERYTKAVCKWDFEVDRKLGSINYLTWTEEMRVQLKTKKVLKIVDGNTPQPDIVTRPIDHNEGDHDYTNALVCIRANCEKSQITHLRHKSTSKPAQNALKKLHSVYAKGRINFLLKRCYTCQAEPNNTIHDIEGAFRNLAYRGFRYQSRIRTK